MFSLESLERDGERERERKMLVIEHEISVLLLGIPVAFCSCLFFGLLQFVDEVVPETLKAAAGDGMLPACWAARNGHEGVLQFLHEVVSDTQLQVHPNKMLSRAGVCKMTVAHRARCREKRSKYSSIELSG